MRWRPTKARARANFATGRKHGSPGMRWKGLGYNGKQVHRVLPDARSRNVGDFAFSLLLLRRIVSRIDVVKCPGTTAVHLHDCWLGEIDIVRMVAGHREKATGRYRCGRRFVKL